jgi:hypothetical protein
MDITSIDGELYLAVVSPSERDADFERYIKKARQAVSENGETVPDLCPDQTVYLTFTKGRGDKLDLCGAAGVRLGETDGYIDFVVGWGPRSGAIMHYADTHFEGVNVDVRASANPAMLEEYLSRDFVVVSGPDENGVCHVEQRGYRPPEPEPNFLHMPYNDTLEERDRDYFEQARLRRPVRSEELRCQIEWMARGDPREPWLVHCPKTGRFLGIGVYEIGPREWDRLKIVLPADLSVQPAKVPHGGGWRHHSGRDVILHRNQLDQAKL